MERTARIICRDDSEYPRRLHGVAKVADRLHVSCTGAVPDAPLVVGIVGSRAASGHTMAMARALAAELGEQGAVIISGGAIGIDTAAHRGALDAGAGTVAILANGLEAPYPARNRPLFADIVSQGGALVTAYPNGTPPKRYHFVERNRLIAALADVVVVACAQLASGALYTASFAAELGRVVGAVPGTPGCEQLIARGAAVVDRAADVHAAVAGAPRRPTVAWPRRGTDADVVLSSLSAERPRAADDIVRATGLSSRAVKRELAGLELEGLALPLAEGAFLRSSLAVEVAMRAGAEPVADVARA